MYDAGLPEPVTPQAAVMSPSSLLYSLQFRAVRVTILIAVISATMSIISSCQRIHRYVANHGIASRLSWRLPSASA